MGVLIRGLDKDSQQADRAVLDAVGRRRVLPSNFGTMRSGGKGFAQAF
jgi:hypothetical protein